MMKKLCSQIFEKCVKNGGTTVPKGQARDETLGAA